MRSSILSVLVLFMMSSTVLAGETITRQSGGSIKTELGYGIVLNKGSSLNREWITIHNTSIPADLVGTVGVKTIYESSGSYSSGGYKYKANYKVEAKGDLAAIEVRFLTFDIWGDLLRNLSATDIIDLKAGDSHDFDAEWNVYSENEVSEYYASIAYISQVRTKSGRVIKTNPQIVVKEAKKFSSKFKASDLEPEPKKK